jgi:CTP synthase
MQKKYIVVTGGVISGLGKGITTASIGNLLSQYKVVPIKCDGYLNTDPGTMNPIEHGEVFVLDDGGEVDMDFGHYERFLNNRCTKDLNITMGRVYEKIRDKERKGDYLGRTVQLIPHVSELIRDWYIEIGEKHHADIIMVEIGGTLGDMENELYIEAARMLSKKVGHENTMHIHLTYVPIPFGVDEQKSKPTQQSVNMLRRRGIDPDIIIARCEEMLSYPVKQKIASFCDIAEEAVITAVNVNDIYKIPLVFEDQNISQLIARKLNIAIKPQTAHWKQLIENKETAQKETTIALCGKYTLLQDSYASVVEALNHCAAHLGTIIHIRWISTAQENFKKELEGVNGVIVPGGFGKRGTEEKIQVIQHCRENNIPFLGICYGLQMAVIEFARNVCGLQDANTTEVAQNTKHPVVDILESQKNIENKGGTMRLGAYPSKIKEGTTIAKLYQSLEVSERHRHRYEVNPEYHKILQEKGLVLSGLSEDNTLVEFIELPNHPYFVATQAHPELKSSLLKPAPVFYGLVQAAIQTKAIKKETISQ